MRHGASLLASLEGMSRPAYLVAKELSANSRSGLTIRFLSKKLELPEEEIEYLVDINPRLIYTDITKIRLVAEGQSAIRRIAEGLENHGDVPSLFRRVKALVPHDFRRLEEQVGIEQPSTKKALAEALVNRYHRHPDSVVSYVATRGFSETAREVFDVLWQSKKGIMSVSQVRVAHGGTEFDVEQALWELFRGFALFEMFRFDAEDRLVRVAGLLSELRQYRETASRVKERKVCLKPLRKAPRDTISLGLSFSDTICRLIAAIAARPVRLRGDGELFREDRRRLAEVCPEEDEPSLNTCLWVAEGVGWLVRVDNLLRAGELEPLIKLDRVGRHRILFEHLCTHGDEAHSRASMNALLEESKVGDWFSVIEVARHIGRRQAENVQPVLRSQGAHWAYINPAVASQAETRIARSLEGTLFWLGVVDRAYPDGEAHFSITPLGASLLTGEPSAALDEAFPPRRGEFVVQPNFDIVVPTRDMDPLLTVPLDQFAVRVSTGQATVYNVTRDSFTQAMQDGHDPNGFVDFLLSHNRGGTLPSNVMMTLDDWRGAMKRVRLRTIHVLETDDPLVMVDLMHRRRFTKHLEHIDPGKLVAYRDISRADLTKALEKNGFIVE